MAELCKVSCALHSMLHASSRCGIKHEGHAATMPFMVLAIGFCSGQC